MVEVLNWIKKVIYKREQGKHKKEYQIAWQWAKKAGVRLIKLKRN